MSLISQTTSYTIPGTHTYTIPQGVGSLEFHLWGAGGADGGRGPSTRVQTGTTTSQLQTGSQQVQTGTIQVQSGTHEMQTGSHQVQSGSHQEAYTVSVAQTDNKGNPVNNKGGGVSYSSYTAYRTVPDYITVADYTTVPTIVDQAVFTTQPTYTTITTPVYSTQVGGSNGAGAGGGYASRTIQVHYGDVIVISVGSAGMNPAGGQSILSPTAFNGGSGAAAFNGAAGGGGGGATVITVNGVIVAVAAGGGGGGGGGIAGQAGTDGIAATISGIGSGIQGSGISSVAGPSTGGGGGGGFYSGLAGTSGTSGSGGSGGVSYGTVIQSGSAMLPGGAGITQYPGHNIGYANFGGAALLIFNKSFNINIKRGNNWDVVNSAFVKVNGNWKGISNGWTKVSGVWIPLISAASINGAENLITPSITYALAADAVSINEGDPVIFTLTTTGLTAGQLVPYTISGIDIVDLTPGVLSGHFVVGTTETITLIPTVNHTTNGIRTLRVSIDNTTITATCTILDTSLTPVYNLLGNHTSINEGETVIFTLSTTGVTPGEVIPYSVSGITAARLSAGSLSGNFIVGTTDTASFTLLADHITEGTGILTITLHGKPGSASCTIVDSSILIPHGTQTFTVGGMFVVPDGVTTLTVVATGAGGGGGGADGGASGGYYYEENGVLKGGFPGAKVTTTLTVFGGQVYDIGIGYGGGGGTTRATSGAGGAGGSGVYIGGRGGYSGGSGSSGAGGGGGGATTVRLGTTVKVVAGGGAGAGGSGNGNYGVGSIGTFNTATSGAQGEDKSGDGGGGGGGGGGYPNGGAGGPARGGDSGAYSGTTGQSIVAGGSLSTGTNGGTYESGAGGNGSVILTW